MKDEDLIALEEQGIDIKKWLRLFIRNWLFFAGSIMLAILLGIIFISLSTKQYELSTHILVNREQNPLDKAELFTSLYSDPYQLENEKGVLRSKSVTSRALRQLDFRTSYYIKQGFNKVELYKNTPFTIEIDTTHLQPVGIYFSLVFINDSLMKIEAEGEEVILYDFSKERSQQIIPEFKFSDTVKFGQITGNSYCRFTILPGYTFIKNQELDKEYYCKFHSLAQLITIFRNFKIENDRGSSILSVSFRYRNPGKAGDFLNKLVKEYLIRGVERDNKIAIATIRFIDAQLGDIVDSLYHSGERLQDFQSSKQVLDIGFQAEKVYTKLEVLEVERAKLLVKKRYFSYLLQSLQTKSDINDLIAPTTLEINDPVLNSLIVELAELYSERTEISFNSIKDNPYLSSLEVRIDDTRRKLIDAASTILEATEIEIEETNTQIFSAEQTLNRLPKDQQQLLNIERKFKLNDELYTYLLTRRSEMEIFKASNLPANEILDVADPADAVIVSPNVKLTLILALMLGFFCPGALIYFRETFNNKIRIREDIQKISKQPIVGQVIDSKLKDFSAVLTEPNSVLTESYRTLRTNLQFVIDESKSNTILITSAIQGEGKSFTALNLASVYAFYGKKTILVDFDLRKSHLREYLGLNRKVGLSNYLSKNAGYNEIIYSDEKMNFDLILAGPIPPNPSELAASDQAKILFKELNKKYDIIIVDSPPVGVVSDALQLYSNSDIILLVVRYNFTSQEVLTNVLEDLEVRKIEKINILLNDVVLPKSKYGYGYGYGYGYVEGSEERKGTWKSRKNKSS
ncbi:MAG: polysaccharide biosynthesis tyrosine autokinase [Bacteroidales bacterium]|nr:polysaccharide biosynthesis tyrosine autokinase [Bacteroidales bacterium]